MGYIEHELTKIEDNVLSMIRLEPDKDTRMSRIQTCKDFFIQMCNLMLEEERNNQTPKDYIKLLCWTLYKTYFPHSETRVFESFRNSFLGLFDDHDIEMAGMCLESFVKRNLRVIEDAVNTSAFAEFNDPIILLILFMLHHKRIYTVEKGYVWCGVDIVFGKNYEDTLLHRCITVVDKIK